MAVDYNHFLGLQGASNRTGFSNTIFAAPKSWFDTLQKTIDPPVAPGDSVVVADTHTFIATKGFVRLAMTEDTVELLGEVIGDNADSMGHKIDINAFLPGLNEVQIELSQCAINEDWVLLVQDCERVYQVGCECSSVKAKTSPVGGKLSGGTKGHNWVFTGYCPLKVYKGTITEKP